MIAYGEKGKHHVPGTMPTATAVATMTEPRKPFVRDAKSKAEAIAWLRRDPIGYFEHTTRAWPWGKKR